MLGATQVGVAPWLDVTFHVFVLDERVLVAVALGVLVGTFGAHETVTPNVELGSLFCSFIVFSWW